MENEIWLEEEKIFLKAIENIKIPNATLDNVSFVTPHTSNDLNVIPESGGCYWIWTNEPVNHYLHKNETPVPFNGGEIVYNGIAKDNVRGRVKHHLFGHVDAGWSGISLDVYFDETTSHRKKALSEKGKVPFIKIEESLKRGNTKKGLKKGDLVQKYKPIRAKEDFLNIFLSEIEKNEIENMDINRIYFRNGINITEDKHKNFQFKVFYITNLSPLYLEFIEKKWRQENGLPKLCSYSSGR